MSAALSRGTRLSAKGSDPCCQAPTAKNRETGAGGGIGTEHGAAQLLVAARCVRRRDD